MNLSLSIHNNTQNNNNNNATKKTIAFLCKPSINYVITLFSIWRLGRVAVPLSPLHPTNEILHVIKDSKSEVIIVEPSLEDLIQVNEEDEQQIHTVINFENILIGNTDAISEHLPPLTLTLTSTVTFRN